MESEEVTAGVCENTAREFCHSLKLAFQVVQVEAHKALPLKKMIIKLHLIVESLLSFAYCPHWVVSVSSHPSKASITTVNWKP